MVPRYLSLEPRTPNPAYDGPHHHAERYRSLSRKLTVAPREDEHKNIVDAAHARRPDETVALSKRHFELTAEIILERSSIG